MEYSLVLFEPANLLSKPIMLGWDVSNQCQLKHIKLLIDFHFALVVGFGKYIKIELGVI